MFGKKNQDRPDKKVKRALDKIVMGAVIGGAIGSVLGASIAPKKGSETRKEIAEATKSVKKNTESLVVKILRKILLKKKEEGLKEIPHETEGK